MSEDLFNTSWFIIFLLVIIIAFLANILIIFAILRDRSMHTSTYFYIINVNIADILLLLSCLPERIAALFRSHDGFHLGMFTCYLLPFLQQVSMHAALGFLLILTIHRCYPAGVPRCLQGNFIRRQIRQHLQTLCFIWIFAIFINLPLFAITKYEKHANVSENNLTEPTCDTGATEIWSRTYLIMLLVLTYVITGIFLIIIYGQVIRIILASKKFTHQPRLQKATSSEDYPPFLTRHVFKRPENFRSTIAARSSTSSTSTNPSHRRPAATGSGSVPISLRLSSTGENLRPNNSHSTQHLQVIIMLFIVILLYILLLLPYRLLNLLYIVHNQLFQKHFMNEILFQCLVNTVRLLVFLNCALQPITYVIISSRLRQTVMKFLQSCWYQFYCRCHCAMDEKRVEHCHDDRRAVQAYLTEKNHATQGQPKRLMIIYRENQHSLNHPAPTTRPIHNRTPYTVTFQNSLRK